MKSKNNGPSYYSLAYDAYQREQEERYQSESLELWKDAYVEALRQKLGIRKSKVFWFLSRMVLFLLPHAGFVLLIWSTAEKPWDKSAFIPIGVWFLVVSMGYGVFLNQRMKRVFSTESQNERASPEQEDG